MIDLNIYSDYNEREKKLIVQHNGGKKLVSTQHTNKILSAISVSCIGRGASKI